MTPADKLRELLATRPSMPNVEELTRWWRDGGSLVPELLADLEALDCDLVAARAALRREQDARAELRVECTQLHAELDRMMHLVLVASPVTSWSETLDKVMRRRYAREAVQWKANHDQRKLERDELTAELARVIRERDAARADLQALDGARTAAQDAARRLMAAVDDLGAFADDSDPRVMATAGPIGKAQADLWVALGLDIDKEGARLSADIDSRCAVCGWPLAASRTAGCVRGNCSQRPLPERFYAPERAARERDAARSDLELRDRMEAGHA